MSRRGRNPCLICSTEALGPKDGTVCQACIEKVKFYDELTASKEHTVMALPDSWTTVYPLRGDKRKPLERHLIALYRSFPEVRYEYDALSLVHPQGVSPMGSGPRECFRLVPKKTAAVLADLQRLIYETMRAANAEGLEDGANLLAQLNAGTLTSADFEEQVEGYRAQGDHQIQRRRARK